MTEDELSHLYMWLYGDMPYCGCGWPNSVAQLIVTALEDIESRSTWEVIKSHICGNDAVSQLVLGVMEKAGFIGHGTCFTSSWVTSRGRWVCQAFSRIESIEKLDDAGFPHDGDECPPNCLLGRLSTE